MAAPKQNDALIQSSDFKSIRMTFTLMNTTTRTAVREDQPIRLVEFLDRGLVLEVPKKCCSQGHMISLDILVHSEMGKRIIDFQGTAKVETIETLPQSGDAVTLNLKQFDEKLWVRLHGIFSQRQKEIENFLAAVKGY